MDNLIEVSDLTKKFGSFTAVDQISFSVKPGEIVGLLGPNGAGKTTTIFLLLDMISPTKGYIKIFGLNYQNHRESILQQMNYSSTYIEMAPRLTVLENLIVIAKLYQVKNAKNKISQYAEKFGIDKFINAMHRDLSQGQKTRVSLCKAFLNEPKILLLDEPTASLDPDIAQLVRNEIINAKNRGMTILLTSHNMNEVEEVADRVLFINQGKIVAEDTPEQLAKIVRQVNVQLMITTKEKEAVKLALESGYHAQQKGRYVNISIDEQDIAIYLNGLAELGVEYNEISIDKPTLEDYFIMKIQGGIGA